MSDIALRLLEKALEAVYALLPLLEGHKQRLYAQVHGKALERGSVWRLALDGLVVQVLDSYANEQTVEHQVVCLEQPPGNGDRFDNGKPYLLGDWEFKGAQRLEDYWRHHGDVLERTLHGDRRAG